MLLPTLLEPERHRRAAPFASCLLLGLLAASCDPELTPFAADGGPADGALLRRDGKTMAKESGTTDGVRPADGAASVDGPGHKDLGLYPALYKTGLTQSPLTPYVAQQLAKIAKNNSGRKGRVLAKVGNSITMSTSFLCCFAGSQVNLDGRTALQPTISHFKLDLGGGITPFDRTSLSAQQGWAASAALKGSPSPLDQEVAAISPRFAVVMFGTNDIGYQNIFGYADDMLDIVDRLTQGGVIPLLSSIPPRDDQPATAGIEVPRYNAVLRSIAQGRQVPFVDFHLELAALPDHGLGTDKVHPSTYWTAGGYRACDFSAQGLKYGYNIRNLITLQGLHRAKAVVIDAKPAPDPPGPRRQGTGTMASPVIMEGLPFSDLSTTKGWQHSQIPAYPGCGATQDESGPERIYRLVVSQPLTIRAMVFDRGDVDIDLHLLGATPSGASCIKRDNKLITAQLTPGTYHFSLDTFVDQGGKVLAGEYLFLVLKE